MRQTLQTIGILVSAIALVWTAFSPIPKFMDTMRDFTETQSATQAELVTLIRAQTTALSELAEAQRTAQADLVTLIRAQTTALSELAEAQTATQTGLVALVKAQAQER